MKPKHVAIIMDGNGRWAKKRFLPRTAGHLAGVKAVKRAVEYAVNNKIPVVTLFALSVENLLTRSASEIAHLMSLFSKQLNAQVDKLHEKNVRIRFIGDRSALSEKLITLIVAAEKKTEKNTGLVLIFAINYSGRWDIAQATHRIVKAVSQGNLSADTIDESVCSQFMSLSDVPEPDLLIRTSGECRISNFLLWQLAYTELYFTDVLWPDFDDTVFEKALHVFSQRDRKFGTVRELPNDKEKDYV